MLTLRNSYILIPTVAEKDISDPRSQAIGYHMPSTEICFLSLERLSAARHVSFLSFYFSHLQNRYYNKSCPKDEKALFVSKNPLRGWDALCQFKQWWIVFFQYWVNKSIKLHLGFSNTDSDKSKHTSSSQGQLSSSDPLLIFLMMSEQSRLIWVTPCLCSKLIDDISIVMGIRLIS